MTERVIVLGASPKPWRYSYQAMALLQEYNHIALPVSLKAGKILGCSIHTSLDQVKGPVDTVTLYVNPRILEDEIDAIIGIRPKRVIMNPGTESVTAARRFRDHGIRVIEACTLVLLKTGQYRSA